MCISSEAQFAFAVATADATNKMKCLPLLLTPKYMDENGQRCINKTTQTLHCKCSSHKLL